ncbi:MAG TPA: hypothetical protein VK922_08065 [Gemmatimonadaceae bacterium]|nr:hypothetical protein [Gemmatimonadaceae bacterium]
MRRMTFAILSLFLLGVPLRAQPVPGRDLLRFPLGTMDRAPALGSALGEGLGNPASIALLDTLRVHAGIAAVQTSPEQGVTLQVGAVTVRLPEGFVVTASFARATVTDLVHTQTDPQSIGGDIPYSTQLVSTGLARRIGFLSAGAALRYRRGHVDLRTDDELGADFGLLASGLPLRDLSIGVGTFLWRPGRSLDQFTAINAAADLRIAGNSAIRQLRAGYSSAKIVSGAREEFIFTHARYGIWEGRAGLARDHVHGPQFWRTRLGITVHVAPYAVGIAREENGAGLDAIYQFTLSARLR